jgi:Amt family ammonium transporter
MAVEWLRHGKPSALGMATGAIAGLAAVTPGSGFVGPFGGFAIGVAAGALCWWASTAVKRRFGYDDSLDVFGVHGVGGFLGTVLAGLFASDFFGGNQVGLNVARQLGVQLLCASLALLYTAAVSWAILRALDATLGLRVSDQQERQGLDLSLHEEAGYNL